MSKPAQPFSALTCALVCDRGFVSSPHSHSALVLLIVGPLNLTCHQEVVQQQCYNIWLLLISCDDCGSVAPQTINQSLQVHPAWLWLSSSGININILYTSQAIPTWFFASQVEGVTHVANYCMHEYDYTYMPKIKLEWPQQFYHT